MPVCGVGEKESVTLKVWGANHGLEAFHQNIMWRVLFSILAVLSLNAIRSLN